MNFGVFAYCFLFPFFFFVSACEFQFIEGIDAHGKQNPGFIIVNVIIIYYRVFSYRNTQGWHD